MRITVAFFFLFANLHIYAQQCDGSLGENIFARGNFGVGSQNIPTDNPNIAPGYQYVLTGPPSDGFYTITNNTGAWENLYGTWLRLEDNSPDPNGYMMLVNADFSPGLFYSEEVTDLCENTLYEFSADIINIVASSIGNHILPDVEFLLDEVPQFSTGGIPQNERWNRYGFTFRTPPGVTEMTLTLRNNAPGGIGNDLALDNISFRACGPSAFVEFDAEQTIFLCENDNQDVLFTADLGNTGYEIQWQLSRDRGETWEDLQLSNNAGIIHNDFRPGTYRYRYLAAPSLSNLDNFKCRTLSDELEIEVLPLQHSVIDSICTGLPYPLGSEQITTPGVHMASLISSKGCDSIVTLSLTHIPDPDLLLDASTSNPICAGDSSGLITIINGSGSQGPYTYLLDQDPIFPNIPVNASAGTYQVTVLDRFQCADMFMLDLIDPERFSISAGPDTMLTFGASILRDLEPNYPIQEILWAPPNYLDCATCDQVQIVGIENLRYTISAVSDLGCLATDELAIQVDRSVRAYVPNAFSPNGDGSNDFFNISAPGFAIQEIEELLIFNRWGSLIIKLSNIPVNSISSGWDGTIFGEPADPDTYLYTATLKLLDDSREVKSGTVVLVR